MTIFGREREPHPSHAMGPWESTIVTIISTSRFGELRECSHCGGEQARTVAGQAMHDELALPCPAAPKSDPAPAGGAQQGDVPLDQLRNP